MLTLKPIPCPQAVHSTAVQLCRHSVQSLTLRVSSPHTSTWTRRAHLLFAVLVPYNMYYVGCCTPPHAPLPCGSCTAKANYDCILSADAPPNGNGPQPHIIGHSHKRETVVDVRELFQSELELFSEGRRSEGAGVGWPMSNILACQRSSVAWPHTCARSLRELFMRIAICISSSP